MVAAPNDVLLMSLVGKLEDLGLAEILQIVSLSHKSGVLKLNSCGRTGTIFFRDGQVTRATSSAFPEHLGDLLLRSGMIEPDTLRQALLIQQTLSCGRRLGQILAAEFGVERTAIDALVSAQIEQIVYSFFAWGEGGFVFELGEPEVLAATTLDPLQFMLDVGLNPHWLALEGTRLLDEQRQQRAALVDADRQLVNISAQPSTTLSASVAVEPPQSVADHAALVEALSPESGVQGGTSARNRQRFNIGIELFEELGEASGLTPQQTQQSPGLHLLRGMLEELNNPSLGGGIILLILRFASELMNRAVIFLVKEEEIVGLGQFGIELDGASADVSVRNTRIPVGAESLFTATLTSKVPVRMPLADSNPWDAYLCRQLGGRQPQEVFLGPLLSEGRVVAILYGDNLPELKPVGDTEALEIFLSQAGLAMEKALLERRLMNNPKL